MDDEGKRPPKVWGKYDSPLRVLYDWKTNVMMYCASRGFIMRLGIWRVRLPNRSRKVLNCWWWAAFFSKNLAISDDSAMQAEQEVCIRKQQQKGLVAFRQPHGTLVYGCKSLFTALQKSRTLNENVNPQEETEKNGSVLQKCQMFLASTFLRELDIQYTVISTVVVLHSE